MTHSPCRKPRPATVRLRPALLAAWLASLACHAGGQSAPAVDVEETTLNPVVVTATRSQVDPFELPASIDSIDVQPRLRLGASPAEVLDGIPGLVARDRHNYAQDTQISVRGFGARSTFGIRGVRLYSDGIPASQPDGQGQVSHFNLDSAGRIEVLRGPFSALYGNASGGVIHLFTAEGNGPARSRWGLAGGSDGNLSASVNLLGGDEDFDYNLDYSQFRTDGYRPHSQAQRHSLNSKVGFRIGDSAQLTLLGNILVQPSTQDPLGLDREAFEEDPYQVAGVAEQFNTRKRVSQGQAGAIYDLDLGGADTLRALAYAGSRDVRQFLAIPASAQEAPRHAGGVIDLGNAYGGTELRWTRRMLLAGRPLELVGGLVFDALRQHRRGYENFIGDEVGVLGRLRRDEIDKVESFDQYLQGDWRISDAWTLILGARHSRVRMSADDRYIVAPNPDDSGQVEYSATTPVAGLMFRLNPALHLYASYGRGFETPTLAEAGYRADGEPGLALDLSPARSDNAEIGAKFRRGPVQAQLAVFQSDTRDELAVATAAGGRTTYQNIPRSRRRGAELSLDWALSPALDLSLAYSHLDARFNSDFLGCSSRCTEPDTPIAAGTRIPGVPRDYATLGLDWRPAEGWSLAADAAHSGAVSVNDFGTESAPAYTLFGAEIGRDWTLSGGTLQLFLRGDNLAGREYVGSVIVNDGNGRYYEPGPGRSWLLGLKWNTR
jgi:iron complex outermembrane receptor protein